LADKVKKLSPNHQKSADILQDVGYYVIVSAHIEYTDYIYMLTMRKYKNEAKIEVILLLVTVLPV